MCLYFANSQAFLVPGLALSKVYANILLLLFNNRIKLVNGRDNENDSNWEEALRAQVDTNTDAQPSSPISPTKKNGRARSTSTVFVSNNRLVFRLGDLPPSPQRTRPKEQAGPVTVERARASLEKEMTSSVGTISDVSLHVRFFFLCIRDDGRLMFVKT
jgi:hypothetical protein